MKELLSYIGEEMAKINETLTVTGEDTKIIKVQVEGIKEDTKQNRDDIKYIKEKVENLSEAVFKSNAVKLEVSITGELYLFDPCF